MAGTYRTDSTHPPGTHPRQPQINRTGPWAWTTVDRTGGPLMDRPLSSIAARVWTFLLRLDRGPRTARGPSGPNRAPRCGWLPYATVFVSLLRKEQKWMRGYGARDDPILHAGLLRSHVKNDELLALVDQSAKLVDGDAVHAKLPNERPPPPPSCQPRTAKTPNLPIFIQRPHDPAQRNWSASVRECSRNIRKRTATENFPRAKHHRPFRLPLNGVAL
jgi:hypothetical protein